MAHIPKQQFPESCWLELEQFRQLDYEAVRHWNLSIELMMENAGLQLARLISRLVSPGAQVQIGIGIGNNGGGGLVAARRLTAWGYPVYLHIPDKNLKSLPAVQLTRAFSFGCREGQAKEPRVFVDAYFGFSQRLPLPQPVASAVKQANRLTALRVSLDLPTGITSDGMLTGFRPDIVCTLAAPKEILGTHLSIIRVFIADLGMPAKLLAEHGMNSIPDFSQSGLIEWVR